MVAAKGFITLNVIILLSMCGGSKHNISQVTDSSLSLRIRRQNNEKEKKAIEAELKYHPCNRTFPCLNMGECIPLKSPGGRYSSDYKCDCYFKYYSDDHGKEERFCYEMRPVCRKRLSTDCLGGFCRTGWGNYFCICRKQDSRYGTTCNKGPFNGRYRISSFFAAFDLDAITAHPYFVMYFQHTNSIFGRSHAARWESGDGLYFNDFREWPFGQLSETIHYFTTPALRRWLHTHHHLSDSRNRHIKISQHFYRLKNAQVKSTILITNMGKEVFTNFTTVNIKKDPDECVPTVEMIGCSKQAAGMDNSTNEHFLINRRDEHVFRPYILQDCTEFDSALKILWVSHRIQMNQLNHEELPSRSQPGRTIVGKSNTFDFIQPRFRFTPAVELLVYEIIDENKYKQKISHFNSVKCQMSSYTDYHASIVRGGTRRAVGQKNTLIVDSRLCFNAGTESSYYHSLDYENGYDNKWHCKSTNNQLERYCRRRGWVEAKVMRIESKDLIAGQTLNFLNELWYKGYRRHIHTKYNYYVEIVEGDQPYLDIGCLRNCGGEGLDFPQVDVTKTVALQVLCLDYCKPFKDNYYKWTIEGGTVNIARDNLNVLILEKNAIPASARLLTFKATGEKAFATFNMTFSNPFTKRGQCKINQTEGTSGITAFKFLCDKSVPEYTYFTVTYKFFQVQEYSFGRMETLLEYAYHHDVDHIVLTKGNEKESSLYVKVEDPFGRMHISNITEKIKLSPMSAEHMYNFTFGRDNTAYLINRAKCFDTAGTVRLLSALVDALAISKEDNSSKANYKAQFLQALEQVPVRGVLATQQVTSIMAKIETLIPVPINSTVGEGMLDAAFRMAHELRRVSTITTMGLDIVRDIYINLIQLLGLVSEAVKSSVVLDAVQVDSGSRYDNYEDLGSKDRMIQVRETSRRFMTTLVEATYAMVNRLVETENVTISFKNGHAFILVDRGMRMNKTGLGDTNTTVYLSPALIKELGIKLIAMKMIQFNQDIYWWASISQSIQVSSATIYLSMEERQSLVRREEDMFIGKEIKHIRNPLEIDFKFKQRSSVEEIRGIFRKYSKGTPYKDLVHIYRFHLKKGQRMYINFTELNEIIVKAVVLLDREPIPKDFEEAMVLDIPEDNSRSKRDAQNDTIFEQPLNNKLDFYNTPALDTDEADAYLGILPIAHTLNTDTRYAFIPYTSSCQSWNTIKEQWDFTTCRMHENSTPSAIKCLCNHLSTFSASSYSSQLLVRASDTRKISMLERDAINPIAFFVVVLVMFVLLFVLAITIDRKDKTKRKIIVLDDNSMYDRYAYLVAVYTGTQKNSGTTSKIGIRLEGEKASSQAHILASDSMKILETGSTNWFVIYTFGSLGDIVKLHLWNNLTGHYPSWFCSRVVVRDLQSEQGWVFIIDRWLSVAKGDGLSTCRIRPSSEKRVKSSRRRFLVNVVHFFGEGHMWFGICTNHPRSFYSRLERVAVLALAVSFALLFCELVYGYLITLNEEVADDLINRFNGMHLLLALVGAFVCWPFTFVLSSIFRKSSPTRIAVFRDSNLAIEADETLFSYFYDIEMTDRMNGIQKCFFGMLPIDPIAVPTQPLKQRLLHDKETCKTHASKGVHYHSNKSLMSTCFRVVVWILCIVGAVLCIALSMYLSVENPPIHTMEWLVTVSCMMAMSVFIVEPLKALITAFVATFIVKMEVHDIDMDRGFPMKVIKDNVHSDKFLDLIRYLQEYKPIHTSMLQDYRNKNKAQLRLNIMFNDAICFLIYIVMAMIVIYNNERGDRFIHTQHIRDMLVNGSYYGKGAYFINDRQDIITYLKETFVPTMYVTKYYNGRGLEDYGNTADYYTQIIGSPRLRQLRVKPITSCPYHPARENLVCIPDYTQDNADTANYLMEWQLNRSDTLFYSARAKWEHWTYRHRNETESLAHRGDLATYTGGGYVAKLGRTRENAILVINFLDMYNWLDHLTRFVAIELTLFNGNTGYLSDVDIVFELSSTGYIKMMDNIHTLSVHKQSKVADIIMKACFVLSLGFFIYQQVQSVQLYALKNHFRELWNVYDLLLALFTFMCVAVYLFQNVELALLNDKLDNIRPTDYFSAQKVCHLSVAWTYLKAVWALLVTIRLFKLLTMFITFKKLETIFIFGGKMLVFLSVLLFVVIFVFSMFANLALSGNFYEFRSPLSGMLIITAFIFGNDIRGSSPDLLYVYQPVYGKVFHILLGVFSTILIVNYFRAVLLESHAATKSKFSKERKYDYNLIDYIKEEVRFHCKKGKKQSKMLTKRLRGGGDDLMTLNDYQENGLEKETTAGTPDSQLSNADGEEQPSEPKGENHSNVKTTTYRMTETRGKQKSHFSPREIKVMRRRRREDGITRLRSSIQSSSTAETKKESNALRDADFSQKINKLNECLSKMTQHFVNEDNEEMRREENISSVVVIS